MTKVAICSRNCPLNLRLNYFRMVMLVLLVQNANYGHCNDFEFSIGLSAAELRAVSGQTEGGL